MNIGNFPRVIGRINVSLLNESGILSLILSMNAADFFTNRILIWSDCWIQVHNLVARVISEWQLEFQSIFYTKLSLYDDFRRVRESYKLFFLDTSESPLKLESFQNYSFCIPHKKVVMFRTTLGSEYTFYFTFIHFHCAFLHLDTH